jgi:hypothetical protein
MLSGSAGAETTTNWKWNESKAKDLAWSKRDPSGLLSPNRQVAKRTLFIVVQQ